MQLSRKRAGETEYGYAVNTATAHIAINTAECSCITKELVLLNVRRNLSYTLWRRLLLHFRYTSAVCKNIARLFLGLVNYQMSN